MSTNTNGPARLISSDGHLLAIDPQTGRLRPANAEERRQSLADSIAALAEWRGHPPLDKARALLDRAADEPQLLSHRDRVALGPAWSFIDTDIIGRGRKCMDGDTKADSSADSREPEETGPEPG